MRRLVALHGFTGCGADFKALERALSGARSVVTPEWPGHGAKSGLREERGYSLQSHLDAVTEAAGDSEVELLGYSLGGRIALHWALAHPDRVRRLILVSASPGLRTERERAERTAADLALAEFIRAQGVDAFLHYWHGQSMFHSLRSLPRETLDEILARRRNNDAEGLALSLRHVGTGSLPSLWERLGELKMPVDLVTGSLDVKFGALAREMVTLIPRARHGEVEDAGHAVHLERPGDLAAAVTGR